MKRFALLLLGLAAGGGFGVVRLAADDSWTQSRLAVPHAAIALMPEGTPSDYALFQAVHPSVVAWGEDALPVLDGGEKALAAVREKTSDYRRLGISQIAGNVWMLTATQRFLHAHPELAATSCVDLWGERIVPSWLADADFEGTKAWWGCTNQPQYQEHLLARLRAALAAGATMVHLDDHSGTAACAAGAGGCFCAECRKGFARWLASNIDPAALAEAGIPSLDDFDFDAWLRARHYANRDEFIHATWNGRVPWWNSFLAYQREAALAFVARLRQEAERIAGHPVPVGVNAYNLEPKQLFDAAAIDYFANEVRHFDQEDTIPPVVYRLADALGRPAFVTGTGEDWIAYRQAHAVNRVRGWIAEAYAFGHYFMYSWKKWGYSAATGTLWTEVDPGVFAPLCDFIRAYPDLFDQAENVATLGLLYDNAAADRGHWGVRAASKALLDAGISYRLVISGDDILRQPLSECSLRGLHALLKPDDVVPAQAAQSVLDRWRERGGQVVAASDLPSRDATALDRIAISTTGRVWALPRVRRAPDRSVASNANARTTPAEGGALSRPASANDKPTLIIHLLNRDYAKDTDRFAPKQDLQLTLAPSALGGPATVSRARYFQPGTAPRELAVRVGDGRRVRIAVPELDVWGIVLLE